MTAGDTVSLGNTDDTPALRRIVFCGDSRAAWWPAPTLPDTQCFNRGLPGQGSAAVLRRFDADVAPLRPDVIVVQVGVNDLVALAPGHRDRAQLLTTIYDTIAAILGKARGLGAGVVLTTIFPLARGLNPDPVVQQAIADLNHALRSLAAADVQILESAAVLAGPDGYVRYAYAEDELHLSLAGYAALNAALVPLLAQRER